MSERPFHETGFADSALAALLKRWSAQENRFALDTEGNSYYRYFDRACLLQLSNTAEDAIIDPLEGSMPDGLRDFLTAPAHTFVLHDATYDAIMLRADFDVELSRIEDTSLAAKLLGHRALGLKALLESELGVEVEKTEQRSDWEQRPLREEQKQYARVDTQHLLALRDRLATALEEKGRTEWWVEECEAVRTRVIEPRPFDEEGWRKLTPPAKLSAVGRRVLKALFLYRDGRSRALNRAPFRVAQNHNLVRGAQWLSKKGVRGFDAMPAQKWFPAQFELEPLKRALEEGLLGPDPGVKKPRTGPQEPVHRFSSSEAEAKMKQMKEVRDRVAQETELDAALILSKRAMSAILIAEPKGVADLQQCDGMSAWRCRLFGESLLQSLHN